jgi:peptidylprolyl isomerase
VIAGWTQGIPGMKEGGRRQLTIPPDLAYRDSPPQGSGIAPGETLVFVIDLIKASG